MHKRVLLVDDDEVIRDVLGTILSKHGYQVDTAADGREALAKVAGGFFDHIITDLSMPIMDGLELLQALQDMEVDAIRTVISGNTEFSSVSQAFKLGASDFIAKPFQSDQEILLTLRQAEEKGRLQKDNVRLQKELEENYIFSNIVARSRAMTTIFKTITKIADYKTTVLITGESGTGKELIARAIHYNSIRKAKPLVDVNCGGIPENLLESEMFGYVKGAFTDANRTKKGLFEEADGGTLFLDEIGDMPMSLQVKLLRALQEEEIRPLGYGQSIKVDVRIIAATAKKLRDQVRDKQFRDDLFYRINVLAIEVPPLRERQEDIPLLIDHFVKKYNQRLGLSIVDIDKTCLHKLMYYSWPGNVRELENVIERGMALAEGDVLTVKNLPAELFQGGEASAPFDLANAGFSIKQNRAAMERQLIAKALSETSGNRTHSAALLEISIPALLYKMKEYELS
ncbi:MAG: sigma-54 dependent transcriptional regulator [Desulfobulbaceae bacterium]|nr:sigma-54 dependent transcriptional regulator [Desulfobulbaceae bacterium]